MGGRSIASEECIDALCALLCATDVRVQNVALEGIHNLLKAGETGKQMGNIGMIWENKYAEVSDELGGVEEIEELQEHQNEDIYNKAVYILETYFGVEEEEAQLAPTLNEGQNAYEFGQSQASGEPSGGYNFG